jgi:L-threonylcarbamoyladenylate synthase
MDEIVRRAADWIRQGGVVVFPTETFYGLAADPAQERAVAVIFELKGRPAGMAIPLVAASVEQVEAFAGPLGTHSRHLAGVFWPGPLSLVLDAPPSVADGVHAGTRSVAIRVPAHPLARALAGACGFPVTATSANRSGQPAVEEVGRIGEITSDPRVFVLDGGRTPGGAPSTIVDARARPVRIVRDGAVPRERVLRSMHE